MANPIAIEPHALSQENAGDSGSAVDLGANRSASKLVLVVTENTGSDLEVYVDTSADGSTQWREVGSFDTVAAGATSRQKVALVGLERFVRVRWTLGTTATFRVAGTGHLVFADADDLEDSSINANALATASATTIATGLINASSKAFDLLFTAYKVPITRWPESVRQYVADIAVWLIFKGRGFDPDGDEMIREDARAAMKELEKLAKGIVRSPDFEPASNLDLRYASGDPDNPDTFRPRFSANWGDFH